MAKTETIVAITDAGGRGAALVEAYAKSSNVDRLFAFPGNDWMQKRATTKPVETFPDLKLTSVDEITDICMRRGVSLADVCQDNAVAVGTVNSLRESGILTIGPTKEAGQLEWSKAYAREIAAAAGVPQPDFQVFDSAKAGLDYIYNLSEIDKWVKADGLAEGKAALPVRNRDEAIKAIAQMSQFGEVGKRFLIEDWLRSDDESPGEEFSAFALCSGNHFGFAGFAQDYKRRDNFDQGPNTGSMGSIAPLNLNNEITEQVGEQIEAILAELHKRDISYNGVLYYSGMVLNKGGKDISHLVEINSRWGDPEIQAILPGFKNDWYETSLAIANDNLDDIHLKHDDITRVVITLASRGYPGDSSAVKGKEIHGVDDARGTEGVDIYGAGVKIDDQGKYFANGGRLLYVVGNGENIVEARSKALGAMGKIYIEDNNAHYRTDIGWRGVSKFTSK
jgi:phosphoribosylamine--glycine ligase